MLLTGSWPRGSERRTSPEETIELPCYLTPRIAYGLMRPIKLEVPMKTERLPLRRSRSDRMVAGVCGGLGEFFGLSPLWFRVAFLIALLPGGVPGLLLYFLMWIIIPNE